MMGGEIDVLVAEAMGWTLRKSGYPVNFWLDAGDVSTGYCDQPWPDDIERYGDAPEIFSPKGVWNPQSNIIDALNVVVWMEQKGFWCQMRTPFDVVGGKWYNGYWAGFTPHGTSGWNMTPDHWTSAETLPLAICLAFLKARAWR
jgi:hypothetical protein